MGVTNGEPTAQISLYTANSSTALLCKEIVIDNGEIKKLPFHGLCDGKIETLSASLSSLESMFQKGLGRNQALGNGIRKPEFTDIPFITTKNKVKAGESIARTKDFIEYSKDPAFCLLDSDNNDFTLQETRSNLLKIMPELENVGMLLVSSSSAGIHKSEESPPEERKSSCHIYIIVECGERIPDLGKFIEYRAWAHGFGHIKFSSTGAMLKRHLFDDAVYSPERLIYEAPPILGTGISQLPREIIHIQGGMLQC